MRLKWILAILLITGMVVYNFTITFAEEKPKDDLSEFIDKFSKERIKNKEIGEEKEEKKEKDDWNIYYFFSFSMPSASLTNMMDQAERADMTMVIRGMKNNSMKETANAIQKLGKAEVDINPLLYKKFGINKVPALVLAKGKCDNNSCAVIKPGDFFVIYGDVTLDYALNQMIKEEPSLEEKVKPMLAKLKGGFYTK